MESTEYNQVEQHAAEKTTWLAMELVGVGYIVEVSVVELWTYPQLRNTVRMTIDGID